MAIEPRTPDAHLRSILHAENEAQLEQAMSDAHRFMRTQPIKAAAQAQADEAIRLLRDTQERLQSIWDTHGSEELQDIYFALHNVTEWFARREAPDA